MESTYFLIIWQCTWGHILTTVWYLEHQKGYCNPSRRFIDHNCKGLVIVTFCWLTGWHQGEYAWEMSDFRARNMHESPFLFSPLCRMVPCTKGMYCIGYLLILQLDCPVYTCYQLQHLRIVGRTWCAECSIIFYVYDKIKIHNNTTLWPLIEQQHRRRLKNPHWRGPHHDIISTRGHCLSQQISS
jgi:hypothetical protein